MLTLTRAQILNFRRHVNALDQRLPAGAKSLRQAAWAGLQDSMPRAALLSLHARVEAVAAEHWEHPSLVQLWGPRYNDYVIAQQDLAVFSLGRLPGDARGRLRAESTAERLRALLGQRKMSFGEAERQLGLGNNSLRYAAATGTVLLRWDGARQPTVWCVPPPALTAEAARLELARRYLHIFGPATPASFERWAGIRTAAARTALRTLQLTPVKTPTGEAFILPEDEHKFRAAPAEAAPARLLPSGDAFYLLWGADRELLVPHAPHRTLLWTTRVWPGAILVRGEIAGVWRRSAAALTLEPWRRLTRAEREAVAAEAATLPLPAHHGHLSINWK